MPNATLTVRASSYRSAHAYQTNEQSSQSVHVDEFFARHPEFDYDASQPVVDEFNRMSQQLRWNGKKRREKRRKLENALALQFNAYYGTDVDDINAWKAMCVVLGVKPIPEDLKSCRKVRAASPFCDATPTDVLLRWNRWSNHHMPIFTTT